MKKIIVFVVLIALVGLTGCGAHNSETNPDDNASANDSVTTGPSSAEIETEEMGNSESEISVMSQAETDIVSSNEEITETNTEDNNEEYVVELEDDEVLDIN